MVPRFDQTTRALAADRGLAQLAVATALFVLVTWGLWLAFGTVPLVETATLARVQADGVARLRAPLAGEVVAQPVALGATVSAGDVLLALDDSAAALSVAVARARVAALEAQAVARTDELDATGASQAAATRAREAAQAAARARLQEATVHRDAARRTLEEVRQLVASGAVSAAQLAAAEAGLQAAEARVGEARAAQARASGETSEVRESGSAQAARARQDAEAHTAELAAARAELRRAEEVLDRHRVRTPISGRVGELPALVPGQSVAERDLVAVVVPDAELVVEARFAPQRAAGRLVAGQAARVRIVGSGGQGARAATVREVGSEPGPDGLVTVVLGFDGRATGLHHGLVAEVEVDVEAVAPVELLVRVAGGGP